jgi:hypothetical protein
VHFLIIIVSFFLSSELQAAQSPSYRCESKNWVVEVTGRNQATYSTNLYYVYKKLASSKRRQVKLDDIFGDLVEYRNSISFSNGEDNSKTHLEFSAAKVDTNKWEGVLWFAGKEERLICKQVRL